MKLILTIVLATALVVEVGAHVGLLAGLARREPRWRAVVALFLPPLAPYWGWQHGMTRRTYAWMAALAVYTIALALV